MSLPLMGCPAYTLAEVAQHSTKKDLWLVIHRNIYDISYFLNSHPGGEEVLLDVAGQDATKAFEDVGHSQEARETLQNLFQGIVRSDQGLHLMVAWSAASSKEMSADARQSPGTVVRYPAPTHLRFGGEDLHSTVSWSAAPAKKKSADAIQSPGKAVHSPDPLSLGPDDEDLRSTVAKSAGSAKEKLADARQSSGTVVHSPAPIPGLQQSSQPEQSAEIPIFLSFSNPVFKEQHEFIRNLSEGLKSFSMRPRTLGVTVYDLGVPLVAIKNLMSHSAGLICIAFRRTYIKEGEKLDESDGRAGRQEHIRDKWLTTPWPHIEVGMAFQIDLPILILRESGVMADGILEKGSSAFYLPTFDLEQSTQPYLGSDEWQHIFHKWSLQVRAYLNTKNIAMLHEDVPQPWPWARNAQPS